MALAVSLVDQSVSGNHRVVIADITFDSSYPTGGEPVSAASLGLNKVLFCQSSNKSGYIVTYDYANDKLMAFLPTAAHTHTENTAASYAQNATTGAATAAVGGQVADTTNLSTLVIRAMFVGN